MCVVLTCSGSSLPVRINTLHLGELVGMPQLVLEAAVSTQPQPLLFPNPLCWISSCSVG